MVNHDECTIINYIRVHAVDPFPCTVYAWYQVRCHQDTSESHTSGAKPGALMR